MRAKLAEALAWREAHAGFEAALDNIPGEARGRTVPGVPYSLWQLLEHMRLAQEDILDFCRNPKYQEKKWPDEYWPKSPAPPDGRAWDASIAAFKRDREAMTRLAVDPALNLLDRIPHGSGQTYLREVLLIIDHNAYHIGEIVTLRRMLGVWPK